MRFIARWPDHVPERHEVRVRCSGAYATRRRVWRRRGAMLLGAAWVNRKPLIGDQRLVCAAEDRLGLPAVATPLQRPVRYERAHRGRRGVPDW